MFPSIRSKITFYATTLVVLIFLVLAWSVARLTRLELHRSLDRELAERCRAVAEEVESTPSGLRLPERHEAFSGPEDGFFLLDASGRVYEEREMKGFQPVGGGGERPGGWRWVSQATLGGGTVVVAHQTRQLEESLRQLDRALAALFPLLLLGSIGGGWLLAGRAMAPVGTLADQLERITETSLSLRVREGGDELGRLGRTFNALLQRLQAAFERQGRFTADASHELKTPLALIRAVATQKLMSDRDPEDYRQALRQIEVAGSHMEGILRALLFLARCDAGKAPAQLEEVEVGELLETLAEGYAAQLQITVSGRARIQADATQLAMLWQNLAENAVRHGRATVLECKVEAQAKCVLIRVADNGVGMDQGHLGHVFERFYRSPGQRSADSAGLGLAICHSIAVVHGGTIRMESEPGRGTVVTVELPR